MISLNIKPLTLLVITAALLAGCDAQSPDALVQAEVPPVVETKAWVSAWGTAIYTHFPNGPLTDIAGDASTGQFDNNEAVNQSFRMMIKPTVGGDRARLTFSNAFGDKPLIIENITIAKRLSESGPSVDGASVLPVLINGQSRVIIPIGAEVVTDSAELVYNFGDQLAVSFHIPKSSGAMSWHAEAFASQYMSVPNSGDVTADAAGAGFTNGDRGWFFLKGLDVQMDSLADGTVPFTVVAFGDSITDGFGTTPEANQRYPDILAQRLQTLNIPVGVVNAGINSNAVNQVRDPVTTGTAGIQRFQTDAVDRTSVRSVFILFGTNDLSSGSDADTVYAGLVNLGNQANAQGICTLVSTILPRNDPPGAFDWDVAIDEPQRQRLNELILTGGDFDAVTDAVATALENPAVENQPNNALFVEGLHPNSAGAQVLADAIPIAPLLPPPYGSCSR